MNAVEYQRTAWGNYRWLSQQHEVCERHAREHDMTITSTYTDIGRSRQGLAKMLAEAARDDITAVIVADLARLGTTTTEHFDTLDRLREAGVEVIIAEQHQKEASHALKVQAMLAYAEGEKDTGDLDR